MLIVLGSVKGSPGVTTLSVALACRWPAPGMPLVVELDPAGGDLGSRWHLHDEPGLRNMVATARYGPLTQPAEWSQRLPIGVDVVVAPAGQTAAYTVAAFGAAGPAAVRRLAATRPVLADVGRLDPGSPAAAFLDKADLLLMLTRPQLEDVRHLMVVLPALAERCPSVQLVVSGAGPYDAVEIAGYLETEVAGTISHDPTGADVLAGRRRPVMGWTRRRLLTAARTLAVALASAATEPASAVQVRA
ncbi:hypothetical protein [Micromonospora sp. WMMD1082]|uniref:hypothetical protein n=1 Tax=Micromonospora sp. WMMD1082 TaxID=3016104 RepID=UPI002415B443|nr:hypothetical protein [Micromonospora sp. WMMD1082]MDG4795439.1 hypothetical protein [Micromonospora sp. WMMD1082]